jgi:hypothetical protein
MTTSSWGGQDAGVLVYVSENKSQTAGRVRCTFEDANNGCGIERGGDNNGGAREGKLADLRVQEAEASMQQPASK